MGYDPTYGARPLKRVIQKHLVDRLALGLLQGDYAAGDRVAVDAADGELRFERTRAGRGSRRPPRRDVAQRWTSRDADLQPDVDARAKFAPGSRGTS